MSSIKDQTTQASLVDGEISPSHVRRSIPRPRPRPVLSCLRCRRRKIKCDRCLPCKQCTSTGHTAQCFYHVRAESTETRRHQPSVSDRHLSQSQQTTNEDLGAALVDLSHAVSTTSSEVKNNHQAETLASIQQRLQKLELLCSTNIRASSNASKQKSNDEIINIISPKTDAALSIKTEGPRYHSQNYKKSLLHHFNVAGQFCQNGFDDAVRAPVMNELRAYQERWTKQRRKRDKHTTDSQSLTLVLELLPPRSICNLAVESYFETFEKCTRILHYPSFMSDYHRFWATEEPQRNGFVSFVPQLAAMVAIMYAWEDACSVQSEKATEANILRAHIEALLDGSRDRKKLTLTSLSTRALLIIAQKVEAAQADELWKATGNLLRLAMMAGLHRDPSEFQEIGIFEGELRRRLWMSIVEMDLEASLIYGMPFMLREGDFTCRSPSNLNDAELYDGMSALPLSNPLHERTDGVFQAALADSFPLRLQALVESTTKLENVQSRIHDLETHVQNFPVELNFDDTTKQDVRQIFAIVLLHSHIRRVLSYLHRSSIALTNLAPEAITTGLQSSLSLLSYQKLLDPEAAGGDRSVFEKYWNLYHVLCKSDIMQAALDVCLHAQVPGLVSWTRAVLLLAIDDTIDNLKRRISRRGNDIKDVLRLSVILQMLKSQVTKSDREEMMRGACETVLMACRTADERLGQLPAVNQIHRSTSQETQSRIHNQVGSNDMATVCGEDLVPNYNFSSFFYNNGADFDLMAEYPFASMDGDL